ncbi:MAG: YihA family ribosome biogenesis GTP-binding protein [Deltaproteobacteria bacterium]|nr:YihA family ribosome biogenesis GTP-binding protein [Deltaproteobacteria bacterium]
MTTQAKPTKAAKAAPPKPKRNAVAKPVEARADEVAAEVETPTSAKKDAPRSRARRPLGLPPEPVPEGFPGRVEFIKSAAEIKDAPSSVLPEIALCGRSNVGKSSLINRICNRRQLARVSTTPGRTRLINFFDVQGRVMLVDLPGFGFATGSKAEVEAWGETIQGYLTHRRQLCLSLLLTDARRLPEREEEELLMWFRETGLPCLAILTKVDKVGNSELENRRRKTAALLGLQPSDVILFSSLDGRGKDEVWSTILSAAKVFQSEHPGAFAELDAGVSDDEPGPR